MTHQDNSESQARLQVESIVQMVAALSVDYDRLEELREFKESEGLMNTDAEEELHELSNAAGDCTSEDEAMERIQEGPLSIEVRSGWHSLGETLEPSEFRIVLCTGGPHVEIRGELDSHKEPSRVRIMHSDWGTSGELFDFDHDAVLTYCQQFYFGE
jgi:hypothetical protein